MQGRQRRTWPLRRAQPGSREPPRRVGGARGSPGERRRCCSARRPGEPRAWPARPGLRALMAVPSRPPALPEPLAARGAGGAAPGPQRGCHRPPLRGPRRVRPASRAHREPLAPPAAASGHAESAAPHPRVTTVAKGKGGWGIGVRGRPQRPGRPMGLCPGEQAPSWERPQRGPCPLGIPGSYLAIPDFVPLCSMQEKLWKGTRIARPLARVTRPQEKQPSYPTSWSAAAGALAGCWSSRHSAPPRAPVQGEKQRCNIFKVSQSIQLHPDSRSRRQTELMFYTFGYRFEFFPPHAKYLKPLETHDLTINDCAILSI